MKLDEIQDIETLRNTLKSLMCKCIKEIELTNFEGKRKKIQPGEYLKFNEFDGYYITDEEGYSINSYDIEKLEDYFKFPKEGDA